MKIAENSTRWTLLAAATEAAVTGLVLFVRPQLFAWLVFGTDFSEAGSAIGRLAAIALFGLALATWPALVATSRWESSVRALLVYNVLAAVYLVRLGIGGQLAGLLLWPAVALHVIFASFSVAPGWPRATTDEGSHTRVYRTQAQPACFRDTREIPFHAATHSGNSSAICTALSAAPLSN